MRESFADLHIHTNYSDGNLDPSEIVDKAVEANLQALSITDHDCVDGLQEASEHAKKKDIELIPGIEFSCRYRMREVHILGYFIDTKNKILLKTLEKIRSVRAERIIKMVELLNKKNIPIKSENVFSLSSRGSIGRPHVARALVDNGFVKSHYSAFSDYIGNGKPCYVDHYRLQIEEAVDLIEMASGVAVIAHPKTLGDDMLIPIIKGLGVKGLEVYHPDHSKSDTKKYLKIAKETDLCVTGGTDFHGFSGRSIAIGAIKIDYALVDILKERKRNQK